MAAPSVGQHLRVRYIDGYRYVLHVEVTEPGQSDEFVGRIDGVFAEGDGEVSGGSVRKLLGQEMTFKASDIVA
jgi:hypothetical protein